MIVREASLDDLETIVKLKYMMFVDAQLEHLLSENFNKLVFNEYTKLYSKKLANHFIIENDNKIVAISDGFIKNDIPYSFYKKPQYGFIGDMNTLKEYRRLGYAKLLLEKTVDWLKKADISKIQLLASSDGIKLYKDFGFKENPTILEMGLE